jgi:hypothetical protein
MGMHLLRRHVLRELHGRLWHPTPSDRFEKILEIGVSLSDFDQFDPEQSTARGSGNRVCSCQLNWHR